MSEKLCMLKKNDSSGGGSGTTYELIPAGYGAHFDSTNSNALALSTSSVSLVARDSFVLNVSGYDTIKLQGGSMTHLAAFTNGVHSDVSFTNNTNVDISSYDHIMFTTSGTSSFTLGITSGSPRTPSNVIVPIGYGIKCRSGYESTSFQLSTSSVSMTANDCYLLNTKGFDTITINGLGSLAASKNGVFTNLKFTSNTAVDISIFDFIMFIASGTQSFTLGVNS